VAKQQPVQPEQHITSMAVVEAARAGDESAWAAIFDHDYDRMFRFFRSRVATVEQAEDLAANVFLEAFRSISRFQWQGKPFEAWLFGIARNQLASYYRSKPPDEVTTELHTRDEFLEVEVRDILERLRPDHRTALELRFIVGLSGVEAAAAMERSHGSFRSLLLRAVRAFRAESQKDSSTERRIVPRRQVGFGLAVGGSDVEKPAS
jgi:RNA polymerase sigma-70 factor (ECF subfamily)